MKLGYSAKDEQQFWVNVNKEESSVFYNSTRCWEWKACRISDGYGQTRWCGEQQLTHRVSWMLFFGKIPDDKFVLHHCDNPPCCNPEHLFIGTHQDNMDDKTRKGRGRKPILKSGGYIKPGEKFERPKWHLSVYGGKRQKQGKKYRKQRQDAF